MTEISEIVVYPLTTHFILQLMQNKNKMWLFMNYFPMVLLLIFYGVIFLNNSSVNMPIDQFGLLSQFSTFENQSILGLYSIIYSLFIYSMLAKKVIVKDGSQVRRLIQRNVGWFFIANTFFLLSRILLGEVYFVFYATVAPILLGIPFVLTAYILFKYEKRSKMKSILSTSFGLMNEEAKDRGYLYLSLGLIYMAYLVYAIEYFVTGHSFYIAIRPGATLFIVGHLLYFMSISHFSIPVKEWIITILMACTIVFILLYFQMSFAQVAGMGIPLIMILFTILFSNLNRLLFIAFTSLGIFIYFGMKYPEMQYTIQSVDHISRILLLMIFSSLAVYIQYILKKRGIDYNHNVNILQLNSDLAHVILNKQISETESLTMELLSKWTKFSGASFVYLHVEIEEGEPQDYFYSQEERLKENQMEKYVTSQWESIRNKSNFKVNKPYYKKVKGDPTGKYSIERIEYLPLKYEMEVKGFLLSFHEQEKSEYGAFQVVLSDVLSYHLEEASQKLGLEKKLHQLAFYDQLTGLPNRVKFEEVFLDHVQNKKDVSRKSGLFVIDLNNFKEINDQHGHQMGDRLLRLYAQRLRKMIREEDWVSRYGGDEFLVLIPKIKSFQEAEEIKIRLQSIDHEAYRLNSKYSAITKASIGMALFPEDGKTLSQLMNIADQRMYKEKNRSKQNK